jgi:phospholipid/cholesterol/gamma-HCH transport system ATP-binding protein
MNEDKEKLVEMRDVCLRFLDKTVLNGVTLSVRSGDVLVIMGLSGCGKSTLLNILMGLLPADSGSVLFKGQDMTKLSLGELNKVRMHMGMVYQNAALISSLSLGENIALPLEELSDKNRTEIDAIISQKLELVGLKEAKAKLPFELSGGMQKRAGLARALAMNPELVLFDEPSSGLDPVNSRMIDELIIQLRDKQKVTSIVVTHDMDSAFAVATRMAFLDQGKIILEGSPDEFLHSELPLVSQFLSSYLGHSKTGKSHANS